VCGGCVCVCVVCVECVCVCVLQEKQNAHRPYQSFIYSPTYALVSCLKSQY